MDYIEVSFQSSPALSELLVALLSEEEYESFEETETGLKAYIPSSKFDEEKIKEVLERLMTQGNISYTHTLIKERNWNQLWESNFEPVMIGDLVYVRAPFHPVKPGIQYDLVIEPKMSFGTGHHATTSLMMEEMLKMDLADETVLDMGCGSGILAILAAKLGAKNILAIDVEEWAFNNAFENCRRNQSQHIIVQKGDAGLIHGKTFDVILANINRNILLEDMEAYMRALRNEGHLLMSGFVTDDLAKMQDAGIKLNLRLENQASKNQWALIHFKKAS
jgi:ribosomal protein L11 methyltransferase